MSARGTRAASATKANRHDIVFNLFAFLSVNDFPLPISLNITHARITAKATSKAHITITALNMAVTAPESFKTIPKIRKRKTDIRTTAIRLITHRILNITETLF